MFDILTKEQVEPLKYTKAESEEKLQELIKEHEGQNEIVFFEISENSNMILQAKRSMILFFNAPLCFGFPLFLGLTDKIDNLGDNMDLICQGLIFGDIFVATSTYFLYQILRKAVTKVTYKVATDEFSIEQLSALGLRKKTYTAKRQELAKFRSANPLVDFFRLRGAEVQMFGTNMLGPWNVDKDLFFSIVRRPKDAEPIP